MTERQRQQSADAVAQAKREFPEHNKLFDEVLNRPSSICSH